MCAFRPSYQIEELKMSGINGDKARFHRRRKNKIARRLTQKQLYKTLTETDSAKSSALGAKTKPVSE
jgi:hypothetical protein